MFALVLMQLAKIFAGTLIQGGLEKEKAGYMAQSAAHNEALARLRAVDTRRTGAMMSSRALAAGRDVSGQARAAQAASGIAGTDSAAGVRARSTLAAEQDANMIASNAARKAFGFEDEEIKQRRKTREAKRLGDTAYMRAFTSSFASNSGGLASAVESAFKE